MNTTLSTAARRTFIATLATLVLASAFPVAGFAHSDAGMWKVDQAKSSFNPAPKGNTLAIERDGQGSNPNANSVMVISDGKVYRVTGAAAAAALSGKRIDPNKAVLIGKNVRAAGLCGFRCQFGLPDKRGTTLTFNAVNASGQQAVNVLAYDKR